MRHRPSFSFVIPVRDDLQYLRRTLPRVERCVELYGQAELIVVDNESSDGSFGWLTEKHGGTARVLRCAAGSVGAVRNFGVKHSSGDVLCFVDADCLIRPEHLNVASRVLRETGAAAVGSRYELPDGAGWVESTWHRLHRTGRKGDVNFLSAGNLIVKADVFREVGGFDEELTTGEDAELCQRLRDRGYRIYQDPAIEAVHLGNAKTLTGFFRKQRWYSLGMLGTVQSSSLDKPVAGTIVHVALILAALAYAMLGNAEVAVKASIVGGAALAVPLASVVYRWSQIRRIVAPVRSVILYEIFYAARVAAAVLLLSDRGLGWRPEREDNALKKSVAGDEAEDRKDVETGRNAHDTER